MSRSQTSLQLSPEEVSALLRLFPQGVVAVDLETTGLSPLVDKIIEIAAVKVTASGEVSQWHQLINPLIEIPELTIQFHGLTNADLAESPTIRKPLRDFWGFVGRHPVIAHNSTFDLGYLIKASHDFQIEFPPLDIFDSCRYTRAVYKKTENAPANFKLATLCEYFKIPLQHHVALDDTLACLKVTAACAALADADHAVALEKSFVFRLSSFDSNVCFNYSTRLLGLKDLVQQKALVQLEYRGKGVRGSRPVRPIGLMPLPKGPVLFGECLLTGMNKSFLLKKIKHYSPLEASYWRAGATA
jgi:DNA polymerase III epsilon subunit-like protein